MHHDFGYDMDRGIGYRLCLVATQIKIALRRMFVRAGFDVTPEQWSLLLRLHEGPGQIQSELADRTVKDKTTITRILDRLEHKGLAERRRDPNDRRTQRLFLTPRGEAVLAELMPLVLQLSETVFKAVSPADHDTVHRILDTIGAGLDRFLEPKDVP